MSHVVARIRHLAVVPIIRTPDSASALAAVEAVLAGGLDCVEITMTVSGAVKVMAAIADSYGDRVLLGAGTVLDPETARACMLAGAQFLVTPSLNLRTVEMAKRYGVPIFPGALTPTEVLTAWEAGADGIKVFPCNALGGPKYIKALKAPFPQIELFPTGGVNLETLPAFLAAGASAVGVGSELVDNETIAAGNYDLISERTRRFRHAVAAFRAQGKAAD
ncbi:MAG: bifunctional 4-hydroxy-2-oxoglutarate aldolase/2-dehydro-3-deoxy-phosphogluconate aldolase [Acidobacteriaceae bacterium]|nr:bifunctional 4-hydroxy-2-oxoglutarate aldolase/2-dehydro-3-deoxy-phosphogluconate aldolase [Acidobacteriaceae bacterium]MBV8569214.1 bifunctional 4-hydroxy-2-oxoglutarate aldolase/2-dehydro-3-deoxy-phosphogluconate aldolase [Acidobacteriaceae bacterium]